MGNKTGYKIVGQNTNIKNLKKRCRTDLAVLLPNISHSSVSLGNIFNILRYMHGKIHVWSETTPYERKCGNKRSFHNFSFIIIIGEPQESCRAALELFFVVKKRTVALATVAHTNVQLRWQRWRTQTYNCVGNGGAHKRRCVALPGTSPCPHCPHVTNRITSSIWPTFPIFSQYYTVFVWNNSPANWKYPIEQKNVG